MSSQISLEGEKEKENKEDIRVGYRLATDLWTYTDQHFWSMFNAMLLANSILITPIGWLFAADTPIDQSLLSFLCFYVIPLLGIILCFIWFIMTHRAACYRRYYIFTARQLEEKYLTSIADINILSRAGAIQLGEPIEFSFKNEEKKKTIKLPYKKTYEIIHNEYAVRRFGIYKLVIVIGAIVTIVSLLLLRSYAKLLDC